MCSQTALPENLILPADGLPYEMLQAQNHILGQIASGERLHVILEGLCRTISQTSRGLHCAVMQLDPDTETLTVAAAPTLPETFRGAIDGLAAGTAPGSCSMAILRREFVVSEDIAADPTWEGLRETALEHQLQACWSTPIFPVRSARRTSERDTLPLGTVAFYFSTPRRPDSNTLTALRMANTLAALAIYTITAHDKIGQQKFFDPLTKLPNRRLFSDQLKEALTHSNPRHNKLAVGLIDLDHFKDVNDTFGYAVGDFLLRSVAERLTDHCRSTDLLVRFGDDEFGLLIGSLVGDDEIRKIAEQVLAVINQPYDFGGHQLAVTASLGASVYPWDGEDAQTLLRNAENALFTAKRQGRNRFRLYAPTMGGDAFEKLQLKLALGYALENDELEVLYQPKIRSANGSVHGAEALMYWNHPSEGIVGPSKFIPLAEETGLILQLGEWILRRACQQTKAWQNSGHANLKIAVNISALQFREPTFVESVASILRETGLEPSALELEITETIAMTDVEKTMRRLEDLKNLGLRISIDDFGTGYSSLAYLRRFPISTLKIDRAFVNNIPTNKENVGIVKAVLALASNMNLEVVAEGVEEPEQAAFLVEQGCELLQGFHFSRPVNAEAFAGLVKRRFSW